MVQQTPSCKQLLWRRLGVMRLPSMLKDVTCSILSLGTATRESFRISCSEALYPLTTSHYIKYKMLLYITFFGKQNRVIVANSRFFTVKGLAKDVKTENRSHCHSYTGDWKSNKHFTSQIFNVFGHNEHIE